MLSKSYTETKPFSKCCGYGQRVMVDTNMGIPQAYQTALQYYLSKGNDGPITLSDKVQIYTKEIVEFDYDPEIPDRWYYYFDS